MCHPQGLFTLIKESHVIWIYAVCHFAFCEALIRRVKWTYYNNMQLRLSPIICPAYSISHKRLSAVGYDSYISAQKTRNKPGQITEDCQRALISVGESLVFILIDMPSVSIHQGVKKPSKRRFQTRQSFQFHLCISKRISDFK